MTSGPRLRLNRRDGPRQRSGRSPSATTPPAHPRARKRRARADLGKRRRARALAGPRGAGRVHLTTGGDIGVTLDASCAMDGNLEIGTMPLAMPYVAEELLTCIPSAWSCERTELKSPPESTRILTP